MGGGHWPRYGAGAIDVGKAEMAQKVTVALEDDLTGGPAQQTVQLAVDGTDYETGLSAKNAAASGQPARAPHCGSMNCPLSAITPSAMAAGLRLRPGCWHRLQPNAESTARHRPLGGRCGRVLPDMIARAAEHCRAQLAVTRPCSPRCGRPRQDRRRPGSPSSRASAAC